MEWLVPLLVAIITGPVVVILQHLRKENTDQHAESRNLLMHLVEKVDEVQVAVVEQAMDLRHHIKEHHNQKEIV